MATIRVNDIDLYYERYGSGEPLIFLAGFTADHAIWTPLINLLKADYELILVDNRGVGNSSCPDYPYTIAMMAEDIVAFCQALALPPVHIIGSSMGGCIAQWLAYHHADIICSIVLANSVMKLTRRRALFYQAQQAFWQAEAPEEALIKNTLSWVFSSTYLDKPGKVNQLVKQRLTHRPCQLTGYRHQMAALLTFDSSNWVGRIDLPCLVIGCEDDLIALPAVTKEMARRINGAYYICFKDNGHLPFLEQPKSFAQAITQFLTSLE